MRFLKLLMISWFFLSACGSDESQTGNTVTVSDFAFSPKEITVHVGQSVHWQLNSQMMHNVKTGTNCTEATQNGEDMDNDFDPTHTTFDHVFATAGDVPYFCEYHCASNGMTGIVHVVP
jgi:plastocyanin